ncbi:hypothetical protein PMI01_03864 [Caulobacter sp. AP07]|uniref:MmcQ/YjbR family DNA-binding protein n=1 Tax=Caulobacter sp. AP07 TaxID=1144304 RepID=UPI000272118D|nr:MmcQ/YjbR family DNA-binding protein [Caulobacter sp. AP07]EJL27383.1 hypothetical protein PMI01_03864 [Caulobacter sp. AP07]
MTADEFRLLALSLPQVRYATNLGAVNFLIGDRVFATLGGPDPALATLKLSPVHQTKAVRSAPSAFFPQPGGAGARGVTCVRLSNADPDLLRPVLLDALARASQTPIPSAPGRRPANA